MNYYKCGFISELQALLIIIPSKLLPPNEGSKYPAFDFKDEAISDEGYPYERNSPTHKTRKAFATNIMAAGQENSKNLRPFLIEYSR